MKKIFPPFVAFFLLLVGHVSAQDYSTGIGVRLGSVNGITVKHFISQQNAVEGIADFSWGGLKMTGLYQIHQSIDQTPELYWYYGGGAHIGFYSGDRVSWGDDGKDYTVVGLDAVLGLEYQFQQYPFTIGVDVKPVLDVIGNTRFWPFEGGLAFRYLLP